MARLLLCLVLARNVYPMGLLQPRDICQHIILPGFIVRKVTQQRVRVWWRLAQWSRPELYVVQSPHNWVRWQVFHSDVNLVQALQQELSNGSISMDVP